MRVVVAHAVLGISPLSSVSLGRVYRLSCVAFIVQDGGGLLVVFGAAGALYFVLIAASLFGALSKSMHRFGNSSFSVHISCGPHRLRMACIWGDCGHFVKSAANAIQVYMLKHFGGPWPTPDEFYRVSEQLSRSIPLVPNRNPSSHESGPSGGASRGWRESRPGSNIDPAVRKLSRVRLPKATVRYRPPEVQARSNSPGSRVHEICFGSSRRRTWI